MTENIKPFDVLLLEDEPADAYLVRVALREYKIYVKLHHVIDGREGLDFLRRSGQYAAAPRPHLILLDLNMPRMNGREFLAAIKADDRFKSIPVVVLTTSEVERDILASYQLGAAGYITKPVDIAQFLSAISHLEDYWLTLVRLPPDNNPPV